MWAFRKNEIGHGCWEVEIADVVDVFKVQFVVSVIEGVWGRLLHLVSLHVAEGAKFFNRRFMDGRAFEAVDNICTHNVSENYAFNSQDG